MAKTIDEINEKIRRGDVVVARADEVPGIVEENGAKKAAAEIDIVTTATFGAMCSSGAFLNFGHTDPPIKIQKLWLNEVEAYAGLAAVDAYIGATELSLDKGIEYGGAHVIEDLVRGKEINLHATSYGTDCYPRKLLDAKIKLDDLNQATLYNPRNCYQKYNAATNSSNSTVYTYMGTLLPQNRNINFSGTGELSPLNNDPNYRTIGFGSKIFLAGAQGYITGSGTQHSPKTQFGNLTVTCDLKDADPNYIVGASLTGYGTTLLVGIGVPIPVLDEEVIKSCAVRNKDIEVNLFDYSIPKRDRPPLKKLNYEELFSGTVEVNGVKAKTSCLSSFKKSNEIIDILEKWITEDKFQLTKPIYTLPTDTVCKPFREDSKTPKVLDVMTKKVVTADVKASLEEVSRLLVDNDIDQLPIEKAGKPIGIVTSLDITKAVAGKKKKLSDVMSTGLITSAPDENLDAVSTRLDKHGINSTPVVDVDGKLAGIITLGDINRVYRRLVK